MWILFCKGPNLDFSRGCIVPGSEFWGRHGCLYPTNYVYVHTLKNDGNTNIDISAWTRTRDGVVTVDILRQDIRLVLGWRKKKKKKKKIALFETKALDGCITDCYTTAATVEATSLTWGNTSWSRRAYICYHCGWIPYRGTLVDLSDTTTESSL